MADVEWTVAAFLYWGLPFLDAGAKGDRSVAKGIRRDLAAGRPTHPVSLLSVYWNVAKSDPDYWPPYALDRLKGWLLAAGNKVALDAVIPVNALFANDAQEAA
jgi:hypothetical protein